MSDTTNVGNDEGIKETLTDIHREHEALAENKPEWGCLGAAIIVAVYFLTHGI